MANREIITSYASGHRYFDRFIWYFQRFMFPISLKWNSWNQNLSQQSSMQILNNLYNFAGCNNASLYARYEFSFSQFARRMWCCLRGNNYFRVKNDLKCSRNTGWMVKNTSTAQLFFWEKHFSRYKIWFDTSCYTGHALHVSWFFPSKQCNG